MSPTPKQYNELAARLARLETLLESNDVMSPPGAVKLDDLEFGPSQDFTIPDYSQYFTDMIGARDPSIVWDAESAGYDPTQFQQFWDDRMDQNYGFAPTDSAINDLMQRLANLETLTAGTIRDTSQAGALDAITDGNVSGASSGTLGTISSQNADAVAITGGTVSGLASLSMTLGSGSTLVIQGADITGTSKAFRIREVDICVSGVAYKMQIIASAVY